MNLNNKGLEASNLLSRNRKKVPTTIQPTLTGELVSEEDDKR